MRVTLLLLVGLGVVPAASAQNVFLAIEDGGAKMVKGVYNDQAQVDDAGKLRSSATSRYALSPATIYRPGFINFTDFRLGVSHLEVMAGPGVGGNFNYTLRIYAHATVDTVLKNCFMVLELNGWHASGCVYQHLSDLAPGQGLDLELNFKLAEKFEEGRYRLHIFSDGIEVLHSKMTPDYVALQKKKTEALLSGQTQDFPPILAQRANPTYPPDLKGAKVDGAARVRCHVSKNGEVASVELVSATDPAFGAAALAAAPKWKFDPALKGRHFVDAMVEVPIEFKAPR
jgi:TonB family protein